MNKNISIHIATRDRATEVCLLLQSLRTQTIQNWDLIILDDGSGTPLNTFYFFNSILNRIRLEGHKIKFLRNEISEGVCRARNKLIDIDDFENEYICRLDDDIILERNYLELLFNGLKKYDIMTGVIPLLAYPEIERDLENINQNVICEHKFDNEGNLIERKDELAYTYDNGYGEHPIINCHQFRTNAMYKNELKKIRYPTVLTKVGFREELWFSFQALILGYKIGADLGAKAYHLQTPSGGTRSPEYVQNVQLDEETTNKWIKEMYKLHGDFLK